MLLVAVDSGAAAVGVAGLPAAAAGGCLSAAVLRWCSPPAPDRRSPRTTTLHWRARAFSPPAERRAGLGALVMPHLNPRVWECFAGHAHPRYESRETNRVQGAFYHGFRRPPDRT